MTPETLEAAILSPDYLLKVVIALKDETDKRKALEATNSRLTVQNQIMQPIRLLPGKIPPNRAVKSRPKLGLTWVPEFSNGNCIKTRQELSGPCLSHFYPIFPALYSS